MLFFLNGLMAPRGVGSAPPLEKIESSSPLMLARQQQPNRKAMTQYQTQAHEQPHYGSYYSDGITLSIGWHLRDGGHSPQLPPFWRFIFVNGTQSGETHDITGDVWQSSPWQLGFQVTWQHRDQGQGISTFTPQVDGSETLGGRGTGISPVALVERRFDGSVRIWHRSTTTMPPGYVPTQQQSKFAELTNQLYQNPSPDATKAIRSLDRLAAALEDLRANFNPQCETSRQLVQTTFQVLNPYSDCSSQMLPAFKARARQLKLERGQKLFQQVTQDGAQPPPPTPLRRNKSK